MREEENIVIIDGAVYVTEVTDSGKMLRPKDRPDDYWLEETECGYRFVMPSGR